MASDRWTVIDLFSGAGGMSCGFARRPPFEILAAVDLQHAKPSHRAGTLDCNATYSANIGVSPLDADLSRLTPRELLHHVEATTGRRLVPGELTVLIACPPCTDFSRAKPANHLGDSSKNSLVVRVSDFVEQLMPEFL
jgi:DNA (cytosine-5)-methyltransferase 1